MATTYTYLNSYKLYPNPNSPEQKGCIVTVQLSGDETGNLSVTLPDDVTEYGEDYQVKQALEQHYRNLKPEQYQTEIVEKAQAQVDQATSALQEFKDNLATVSDEALTKVQSQLEDLVSQATESLNERLSTVEIETENLKQLINAKDLTDDQKEEIESKYPDWEPDTDYTEGMIVNFDGTQYEVLSDHTSQADWLPSDTPALYTEVKQDSLDDGTEVIKDFVQPTGNHDTYSQGDKVIFNGEVYESIVDDNAYSPDDSPENWKIIQ
ncbi:hypothetical protein QP168_09265 [Aerococcus urinae]|uniref:Carbohydrate-binding protein n=3 Tax=Bacillati TaxID=1783272 RepID=A0A1E9PPM4_9LACT|nr:MULTISPECIES: carbohydrate-binding protein [Aerococcus]KAA9292909.1 hypothetical protein F6I06_02665 [Aerococcus mictus]MBU5610433.1 hypothetical protein [Aerococcus urinae]MCY3064992.1 hypothetical protein [Aerococcus mictus]MCY3076243.1 hypothetical protein [Aerococcus mictus]MCY3081384.1 hypothetical protein [Aerococcus mictus]